MRIISSPLQLDNFIDFHVDKSSLWPSQGPCFSGGNLSKDWVLSAYAQGLYPLYFLSGGNVYWWSPDQRMVLFPHEFNLSRSFRRLLKKTSFTCTINQKTKLVIESCAKVNRPKQDQGTWIYPEVIEAYSQLAHLGYVHSIEVWSDSDLVGGLYGIALGKIFFGESMFSKVSGASRIGFSYLIEILKISEFWLVDCQQESNYLSSLGARSISREDFYIWIRKNQEYLQ